MADGRLAHFISTSVRQLPVIGKVANLADALFGEGQEDWQKALNADMGDRVLELEVQLEALRVELEAHGKRLEEFSPAAVQKLVTDFVSASAQAVTPEKQRAIFGATIRQWDPTVGALYARQFWLRISRQLSEAQWGLVQAIGSDLLVFNTGEIYRIRSDAVENVKQWLAENKHPRPMKNAHGQALDGLALVTRDPHEYAAMWDASRTLQDRDGSRMRTVQVVKAVPGTNLQLSDFGKLLLAFVSIRATEDP